jgi:hypothetical protein
MDLQQPPQELVAALTIGAPLIEAAVGIVSRFVLGKLRNRRTYGSIKSILHNGLDRAFAKPNLPDARDHRNG